MRFRDELGATIQRLCLIALTACGSGGSGSPLDAADSSIAADASVAIDGAPCPQGQQRCGDGICYDLDSDEAHCGICTRECDTAELCVDGDCVGAPDDCTVPGAVCPEGTYCDLGDRLCKPGCANDDDCPQHGSCDIPTHTCLCDSGYASCGDACVAYSLTSCGPDCEVCPSPTVPHSAAACIDGACSYACNPGYFRCTEGCCQATAVAAGDDHACALLDSGDVRCWGDNDYGQLGDGTNTARKRAVAVVGLSSDVVAIGAGYQHTCALTSTGAVRCWGADYNGQIGNGASGGNTTTPVTPTGLGSGVSEIWIGGSSSCARRSSGEIDCWGWVNDAAMPTVYWEAGWPIAQGSLGLNDCWRFDDGSMWNSCAAYSITSGCTDISSGFGHYCAVVDGGALCWGENFHGQVGDGTKEDRSDPVAVTGLDTGVARIVAGIGDHPHSCALTVAGAVKCWGNNYSGELGDGTQVERLTPVDAIGLDSGVSEVAVGAGFTCALLATGIVQCWGKNSSGQLGTGTTTSSSTPVTVLSE